MVDWELVIGRRRLHRWHADRSKRAGQGLRPTCRAEAARWQAGPGTMYVYGLKFVMGYFVVIMDADFSHHPTFIAQMIA